MKPGRSGTRSLTKNHHAGCTKTGALTRCDCAWRGRYKGEDVLLAKWANVTVDPRTTGTAKKVLARLIVAIDNETFDPLGERKSLGSGMPLEDLAKDWKTDREAKGKLHSTGTVAMVNVIIDSKLGAMSLKHLAEHPDEIEDWLDASAETRNWSDNTWNDYHGLLRALLNFGIRKNRLTGNPLHTIAPRAERAAHEPYARQLDETMEAKLLAKCDLFDQPRAATRSKLTPAKAAQIRARVAAGELQVVVARAFQVSPAIVCSIVKGDIWRTNAPPRTKGREMRRRLYFAFDVGIRRGEMLAIQIKHVDWKHPHPLVAPDGTTFNGYLLRLPPAITKGGKTTGEFEEIFVATLRLSREFEARRFQLKNNPEAYLFGREDGTEQKGFRWMWRALFKAAGLDWGRDKGIVWHATRHEFASRMSELTDGDEQMTQQLCRHGDIRTTRKYIHTRNDRKWAAAARLNR